MSFPALSLRAAGRTVSSMRFAIGLLVLVCLASMAGTLVPQGQPGSRYLEQFGPLGADVIDLLDLHAVYSAWWFLLILAFLVLSTSLCVTRNAPRFLREFASFKEKARSESLRAHASRAEGAVAQEQAGALAHVCGVLRQEGWRYRVDERPDGTMVAGKKGSASRIGYILTHSAIVLICLGGLVDSELMVRAQSWLQGLIPVQDDADVLHASHRLGVDSPTYRGILRVKEGERANLAEVRVSDGLLMQPLPFDVALTRFHVDYYETGMPRRFASDIVVHDPATGQKTQATVEVNRPFSHGGVTVYQSGFMDGGSKLKLRVWPLANAFGASPADKGWVLSTAVHDSMNLPAAFGQDGQPVTLEVSDFRLINVQNFAARDKSGKNKDLRNIGPSVVYKLRDGSGQALEFENYMQPVKLDGALVFLLGRRSGAAEPFRYLRIPADDTGSITGWMQLRWALLDPRMRLEAARRHVRKTGTGLDERTAEQQITYVAGTLALFAGAEGSDSQQADAERWSGFPALNAFIESTVPQPEQASATESLLGMLHGALYELHDLARERAGAPVPLDGEQQRKFMVNAALALSDSFGHGAAAVLALEEFEHVQASVFQVSRTPGKPMVYLGCALLVLGVFAMLYIRERRLWVWIRPGEQPSPGASTQLHCAMSSPRRTLEAEQQFKAMCDAMFQGQARPSGEA